MKKIYTFTAGIKRNGQDAKTVAGCATFEGYLCRVSGSVLKPCWDAEAMKKAGKTIDDLPPQMTVEKAIEKGFGDLIVKFGKQPTYWVWNVEAAERKKLEGGKTVFLHERDMDGMGMETEFFLSDKPYPKELWAAMLPHLSKGRRGFEVISYSGLSKAVAAMGWKLNK